MTIERIRELVNKKTLSSEDRTEILKFCSDYGLEFNPFSNCNSCYLDQLFKIKIFIEQNTPETMEAKKEAVEEKAAKCDYELNPELKIDWVNPEVGRVNKNTLTNEMGAKLVELGMKNIFSKLPKNEDK